MLIPEKPKALLMNKTEQFFDLLYGSHMPMYPNRTRSKKRIGRHNTNRQWVFVGDKDGMKSVATQSSLFGMVSDPRVLTPYYTPNGYYRRDQRLTESLRWLNGFVLDVDSRGESVLDILERVRQAGLPQPTALVKTPSGGFHLTYIFDSPVRATPKTIRLYTAIMSHMAQDVGSDPAAVGANRIFRTPTEDTLVYFKPAHVFSFDVFKNWREINHPFEKSEGSEDFRMVGGNIMLTPALQSILHSPCTEGSRDRTCFTLALAMKASNWPIAQALDAMSEWFNSCCSKMTYTPGKRSMTEREAQYKVKYVYAKERLKGPTAEIIRELSGLPFYYAVFKPYAGPEKRENRTRSHYDEWKSDLMTLLDNKKELSGSQKDLAAKISCPLSSFKVVLEMLVAEGKLTVETIRGRWGKTIIRKSAPNPDKPVRRIPEEVEKKKVEKSVAEVIHVDFKAKTIIGSLDPGGGVNPSADGQGGAPGTRGFP